MIEMDNSMPQKPGLINERADQYALDFITKYTKFETDGKVYRALVESFIAFEREMPNADMAHKLDLSYELGQVAAEETPKSKSYADVECPYCGAEQNIDHDDGYGCAEDEIHQQECSECEKYFAYSTAIIFSYTVWQAPCMNEGEHDFRKTNTYTEEFAELECKLCGERKPIEAGTSESSTEPEFVLQSCETCLQLTNHLNGICQKCKV